MTAQPPQSFTFRAEIRQLLDILAHSLYADREVFLRELISNASDALNRSQHLRLTGADMAEPDLDPAIRINGDTAEGTVMVRDTGVGMTHDEMVESLGTIAYSGARAFLDTLAEGGGGTDIIGQFGVGFYSVFMVAEEVRVTSRSYLPGSEAWTWISRGEDAFELVPAERSERGTTVWIKLKEDAQEFGRPDRLEGIVHRHSDFVSYPIYLDDKVVNRQTALWRQPTSEVTDDVYNAFYRELTLDPDPPLARIHMQTDVPVQLHALLFVPADAQRQAMSPRQDFGLMLYVRKILIQAYAKDLLPHYLRFVEGVVDSEDLPLNVSRESLQASPVIQRIRSVLARKVLDTLKNMAEDEPDRYEAFWRQLGPFLKEGMITESGAQEKLTPLLRFHSSHTGEAGLTPLADYVERMSSGQSDIYYVLAQDLPSATASPHLDPLRARGLEVLYLVDPLDSFLTGVLVEFDGHPLRNIDDANLSLPTIDEAEAPAPISEEYADEGQLEVLIGRFRTVLGERAVDVRGTDRLTDSPLRLVAPAEAWDHEMDRVRRLMDRDWQVPPRVVELNPRHPMIRDLTRLVAAGERAEVVDEAILQLYENGLLLEGLHPNPAQMVGRIQSLIAQAVAGPAAQSPSAPAPAAAETPEEPKSASPRRRRKKVDGSGGK